MTCAFCTNEARYACADGSLACSLCAMTRYPSLHARIADVPALADMAEMFKKNVAAILDAQRRSLGRLAKTWFEEGRTN